MGVLVIFAVAILCFSGVSSNDGTKIDCSKFPGVKGNGLLACNRMYKPVCGTDDTTYSNECLLCNTKLQLGRDVGKKHDGECVKSFCSEYSPKIRMCTMEYRPHCGSDGKTYGNKCQFCTTALNSAEPLFLRHEGKCEKYE